MIPRWLLWLIGRWSVNSSPDLPAPIIYRSNERELTERDEQMQHSEITIEQLRVQVEAELSSMGGPNVV